MSLTTDELALGAAFAIAVGSVIQARQAFADLNARTPIRNVIPLLLGALVASVSVVTAGSANVVLLIAAGLLTEVPAKLTPEWAITLTPGQAAELTPGQAAELAAGQAVTLTPGQAAAMTAEPAKELGKWLSWFLGWFFIMIGAFVAVAGTALMLVNDL